MCVGCSLERSIPVSYTHLDVYKRQVEVPGFKGGDRTDIELPDVQRDLLKALKKAGKKVVFINYSGSAIGPVSYTHLVVNRSDSHQRISIAHPTERAQIGFGIHILRLPIQMIGFGRIHPDVYKRQLPQWFHPDYNAFLQQIPNGVPYAPEFPDGVNHNLSQTRKNRLYNQ